jgi:hypothetical protein
MKINRLNPIPPGAGSSYAERLIASAESENVVDFMYGDKYRVVEVHAVGLSTAGKLVMRGYQIAGAASRPLPQWTLFEIGKMDLLEERPQVSQAPREGYVEGDKQMTPVIAEIAL